MKTAELGDWTAMAGVELPAEVARIPSMMSLKERAFLFALARDRYRGAGVVMDAGVFCGASTLCFGAGIRANPRAGEILAGIDRPVRTFEYGIVNPGMLPFFERHGVAGDWEVGGSFEAYLRSNIAPVADLVALTMGDIAAQPWSGEAIEIMFLDVIKSEAIQRHVWTEFLSSLLPGGILIQQDYFIDGLPFLKIAQERLAPWFDYLGEVLSSAVFRLKAPLPPELLADAGGGLALAERLALLDQARDRSIDRERRLICDLGKVRFLAEIDLADASRTLGEIRAGYPDIFAGEQRPRIRNAIRTATNAASGLRARHLLDA